MILQFLIFAGLFFNIQHLLRNRIMLFQITQINMIIINTIVKKRPLSISDNKETFYKTNQT